MERNEEGNRDLKLSNGEPIISATTTRVWRHSACSFVARNDINPGNLQVIQVVTSTINASVGLNRPRKTSLPTPPINKACCNTPDSQDTMNTVNAFVGLNRRRKTSLPSTMSKPEQFREGGMIEVAKREIDLDTCMPLFTKDAERSNNKSMPIAKTEFNGWMCEDLESAIGVSQAHSGRQRRVSLPVLKVDKWSTQNFPSCNSVPILQNGVLSPPIPRVQSGSRVGKKAENRQWAQRL